MHLYPQILEVGAPFPPGTRRHWSVSGRDNKFWVWPGQQLCAPPPPSVLQTGGFSHSLRQEDINYHQQRERERETTLSVNPHEEQLHESRQKPHLSIKHTCTDTHHTLYLHNLHEPDVSPPWLCSSSPVQQRGLCNRCFTLPQPGLESKDKIWMFYLLLYGINLCICVNKERDIFKINAGLDHIIISNSLYLLFYASGLV